MNTKPVTVIPATIPMRKDQLEWLRKTRARTGIPAAVIIRFLIDDAMQSNEFNSIRPTKVL